MEQLNSNPKIFILSIMFILSVIVFISCANDEPIVVYQHNLKFPINKPEIQRDSLLPWTIGYTNGNIRSTRAAINWAQSTDNDFLCYKVFRNNIFLKTIIDIGNATYIDTPLTQNTLYTYTIACIVEQGTSRIDTITIKTPRFLPPSNVVANAETTGAIKITWINNAESAKSFIIERKLHNQPDANYIIVATLSDTSYADATVKSPESYYYRIYSFNPYERTGYSMPTYATYLMNAPQITNTQQLIPTRRVQLYWSDNSNAEQGFRVYRRSGPTGSFLNIATLPRNTTSYIDADTINSLYYESTYYYYIQGYNLRDTTERSQTISITIRRISPIISLSTTNIVFPNTAVGSSSQLSFIVYNVGNARLSVTNITSDNARFVASPTSFNVDAGSSRTVSITFSPVDTLLQTGQLSIFHNAPESPSIVNLSGRGTTAVILSEGFEGGVFPAGWTTGGSANWYITSVNPYSGNYCARSGTITHSQSTYISRTINFTGTRTISFYYKVSSESNYDFLKFYINGVQYGSSWSGESGWQYYSVAYTGYGNVTLRWEYSKDGSVSSGSDAAWIDNVLVQ